MTTLDAVSKKQKPERPAEEKAARELVQLAREQGLALTRPGGLLKQLTRSVLETALNQKMTEHLAMKTVRPTSGTRRMCGTGPGRNGPDRGDRARRDRRPPRPRRHLRTADREKRQP